MKKGKFIGQVVLSVIGIFTVCTVAVLFIVWFLHKGLLYFAAPSIVPSHTCRTAMEFAIESQSPLMAGGDKADLTDEMVTLETIKKPVITVKIDGTGFDGIAEEKVQEMAVKGMEQVSMVVNGDFSKGNYVVVMTENHYEDSGFRYWTGLAHREKGILGFQLQSKTPVYQFSVDPSSGEVFAAGTVGGSDYVKTVSLGEEAIEKQEKEIEEWIQKKNWSPGKKLSKVEIGQIFDGYAIYYLTFGEGEEKETWLLKYDYKKNQVLYMAVIWKSLI